MNTSLTSTPPDDDRLVQRHLAGDAAAFKQIVERYQGMVCALAYSAVGDVARSEDIAQEVFVAAWKQLPQLREPAKLRGWLGGITRNLAHNALRQANRTPTARSDELPPDLPAEGGDPRQSTIAADEAGLMWTALGQLPGTYREPMVMFYRGGRSMAAVAEALEISEETVRQRLTRGRAMLTERMAKLVEETLERSAPTTAFTGMVLCALPGPLAPALFEAAGGGGAATKTAVTVGSIGSAIAKGGVIVKALSVFAMLPALLGGFNDFLGFRGRHQRIADTSERRRTAWAYLIQQASFGAVVLALFVVPGRFLDRNTPFVVSLLWGLGVTGALWLFRRAHCRVKKSLPAEQAPAGLKGLDGENNVFERKSTRILLGLPLYHMRVGSKQPWRKPAIKAWFVISDGRAVGGLFALGTGAVAPVSLGIGAVGLFSLGVGSIGFYALGVVALGWVGCGLLALGAYAAKGICVWAGKLAMGTIVFAPHQNDAIATGFFHDSALGTFAHYLGQWAIYAGVLSWVAPLILTGLHLWQTRSSR